MFQEVLASRPSASPNHILVFETGLLAALKILFPNTIVRGCYFHFTQAIVRKLITLDLLPKYIFHTRSHYTFTLFIAWLLFHFFPQIWNWCWLCTYCKNVYGIVLRTTWSCHTVLQRIFKKRFLQITRWSGAEIDLILRGYLGWSTTFRWWWLSTFTWWTTTELSIFLFTLLMV